MLFQSFKNQNFAKRCSKRGLLKNFGPILGFYTKNSPRNSWSPNFRITIRNQKSWNAGTSCIHKEDLLPEVQIEYFFTLFLKCQQFLCTLESGIDVAPGINVAPPLKKLHITILILFYINLAIAVIFSFFSKNFKKLFSIAF